VNKTFNIDEADDMLNNSVISDVFSKITDENLLLENL